LHGMCDHAGSLDLYHQEPDWWLGLRDHAGSLDLYHQEPDWWLGLRDLDMRCL
jgi:hypothetical protein